MMRQPYRQEAERRRSKEVKRVEWRRGGSNKRKRRDTGNSPVAMLQRLLLISPQVVQSEWLIDAVLHVEGHFFTLAFFSVALSLNVIRRKLKEISYSAAELLLYCNSLDTVPSRIIAEEEICSFNPVVVRVSRVHSVSPH